jgi:hypothetical protein
MGECVYASGILDPQYLLFELILEVRCRMGQTRTW